jgi:chemotaxis protein methyltransferase CheR
MIAPIDQDQNFKKILEMILTDKGFDGSHYKINYIKRRIAVRMRATGAPNYDEYYKILKSDPRELSFLFDRLTIHVTEFFRDPEVYRAIQGANIANVTKDRLQQIKVWCAGCSTGEEPYSVAMLLKEKAVDNPCMEFQIYATDIDPISIKTAAQGIYPLEALRKLTKTQIARWFFIRGEKARIVEELRRFVFFRPHDLLGHWSPELSGFHMIFCRNLLIYLTSTQQQKLYERFYYSLKPGGYLVLGLSETLLGTARKYYRCVDVKNRIYQANLIDDPGCNSPKG